MKNGKVDALLGLQFGDEAKSKITDFLAKNYDAIARFNGGSNSGHTIYRDGKKIVLHTMPSGIFHDNCANIIGNGVVINPVEFKEEILNIENLGIDVKSRLVISDKAHLVLPTHKSRDQASEFSSSKIGSTLKGIGPAYTDKVSRTGFRVRDILNIDFASKFKEKYLDDMLYVAHVDRSRFKYSQTEIDDFLEACEFIKQYSIQETEIFINDLLDSGKNILAEGAQAFGLDIDFGTYPYVTSSSTTAAGVCQGLGISPKRIGKVIGIMKCYSTRVGNGPFPSEISGEMGEKISHVGNEFGSTTGRKRRCGWLDLNQIKYACMVNGVDEIFMTKVDVLNDLEDIKILNGELKSFRSWSEIDLRDNSELSNYVNYIEEEIKTPIVGISYGVNKDDIILRKELVIS